MAGLASLPVNPFQYPLSTTMSMSGCVPTLPCGKRRVGRLVVFFESSGREKNGLPKFLCVAGPCWPMFLVTTFLIVGISYIILSDALPKLGIFWSILTGATLLQVLVAFFLTGCSDPGVQPRYVDDAERSREEEELAGMEEQQEAEDAAERGAQRRVHGPYGGQEDVGDEEALSLNPTHLSKDALVWSDQAKAYRMRGVQYCNETQTLIKDIDHFCPWTGTTIASGNIVYFYWFLFSLFVHMGATFSAMFASI